MECTPSAAELSLQSLMGSMSGKKKGKIEKIAAAVFKLMLASYLVKSYYMTLTFLVFHFSVTKLGKNEMKLLKNWKNFRKVRKRFSAVIITWFGDCVNVAVDCRYTDQIIKRPKKSPLKKKCPGFIVILTEMK